MKFRDAKFEKQFAAWQAAPDDDARALVLLGDPAYTRRFKMAGWNVPISAIRSPDVARKHYNALGFPTSKEAHRQRADYFQKLADELRIAHASFLREAEQKLGTDSALISGGFRDHWPANVKDRARFAARGYPLLEDAAQMHRQLSKSRSPAFT